MTAKVSGAEDETGKKKRAERASLDGIEMFKNTVCESCLRSLRARINHSAIRKNLLTTARDLTADIQNTKTRERKKDDVKEHPVYG